MVNACGGYLRHPLETYWTNPIILPRKPRNANGCANGPAQVYPVFTAILRRITSIEEWSAICPNRKKCNIFPEISPLHCAAHCLGNSTQCLNKRGKLIQVQRLRIVPD